MSFKKTLQRIRIAIGKVIIDKSTPVSPPLSIQDIKKILFVRHDGKIGDYIVSSFVFREIKRANPNIKIGVICSHKNESLFAQNPYIDQRYLVKPKNILSYMKTGKIIAQEQYDIVIDPTVFLRNKDLILLRSLSAKNYIGYRKSNYKLFNFNIEGNLHFKEIYREALSLCGIQEVDTNYDIPDRSQQKPAIQAFIKQNKLENGIAINFFGAANSRKFSTDNIQAFLQFFFEKQPLVPVVLLTYPAVTPLLKSVAAPYTNVFLFEQTQTIDDTIEIMRSMDWIISPDTAIIHIASGLNKKIIGFYQGEHAHDESNQNWQNWHPASNNKTVIFRFKQNINEISPVVLQDIEW